VIVKRGEHGALLFDEAGVFAAPAFPLREVQDPTGAGDTFAGGLMGSLASAGSLDRDALRRAMIYGSVLASFCVERFSLERLRDPDRAAIDARFEEFRSLTRFYPFVPVQLSGGDPSRAAVFVPIAGTCSRRPTDPPLCAKSWCARSRSPRARSSGLARPSRSTRSRRSPRSGTAARATWPCSCET